MLLSDIANVSYPPAAREWKSAGLGIGEAVAWRKRAFGPSEAATLNRAGRSPLEAAGERGR